MVEPSNPPKYKLVDNLRPPCSACGKPLSRRSGSTDLRRAIKQIRPRISPRPDLNGARCTSDRAAIAFQTVAVNIPPKRYCYKRNNGKPEPQRTMRPPE